MDFEGYTDRKQRKQVYQQFAKLHAETDGDYPIVEIMLDEFDRDQYAGTACAHNAEQRHLELLDPTSANYRNGYLLFIQEELVGHVKTHEQQTLMAWRTLINDEEIKQTLPGGIYHLERTLFDAIFELPDPQPGTWGKIIVEDLLIAPNRLFREDEFQGIEQRIAQEYNAVQHDSRAVSRHTYHL